MEIIQSNLAESVCHKPTVNVLLSSKKPKANPLTLGTKQECPVLPLQLNIVLKATVNRKRKNKRHSKIGFLQWMAA